MGAKDPALVGLDTPVADVLITVPVVDVLSVSGIECAYSLHIYSTDGILRASHELCGASAVSIASLDCGTYIAEFVGVAAPPVEKYVWVNGNATTVVAVAFSF